MVHRARTVFALAIALVLGAALAGCVSDENGAGGTDDGGGPGTGDGDGGDGNETTLEWNATLEEAPPWQIGEWWTYRVAEGFTGTTYEATIVVAGMEDDWYLTGAPDGARFEETSVLHLPGIGKIAKDTLAYDVHDEWFQPALFPLQQGHSWETYWSSGTVVAEVVEADDTTATIFIQGPNITMEYDATARTFVTMDVPGYSSYELIDHGFDFEGTVTVPYDYELAIYHGRLAGAVGVGHNNMEPGPPVETVTVSGDHDRATFVLLTFGITPGFYSVEVVAPDGTEYSLQATTTGQEEFATSFHNADNPVGDWEARYVSAGAGLVLFEGIVYKSLVFELPTGCLVSGAVSVPQPDGCDLSVGAESSQA